VAGVKIQGWMPGQFVSHLTLFVLPEVDSHISFFVPRRSTTGIFLNLGQANGVVIHDDFQSQKK
jgi:hypothetical protein